MFTRKALRRGVFSGDSSFGDSQEWESLPQYAKVLYYDIVENYFGRYLEISVGGSILKEGDSGDYVGVGTLASLDQARAEMEQIQDMVYNALEYDGDDALWEELKSFLWEEDALEDLQSMAEYEDIEDMSEDE